MNPQPWRISHDDLHSPKVEGYLEQQAMLSRSFAEFSEPTFLEKLIYSNYLYLSLASGLGGFLGWLMVEPFFHDDAETPGIGAFLLFPMVAGCVGFFLGATEGLMCRQYRRAAISAGTGLGIGFLGGAVAIFAGGIVFAIMGFVSAVMSPNQVEGEMPKGLGLLLLIMGRGAAWALAAIPAGLGQGIALRNKRVALNGLLGGVLGGLIGGLLFDPIYLLLGEPEEAHVSRAIGFTVIGLFVGLFVGLVENWTKSAWVHMRSGPLAGKQFVLYRNPTVIGSSPACDIYLFKDEAIETRHALIHDRGGRFEIEDLRTSAGTFINGVQVHSTILQNADQIVIGNTMFEFSIRENKSA